MCKALRLGSLLLVSLPVLAAAQPAPTPSAAVATGEGRLEPTMRLEAGLILGVPKSDLELFAKTSPGLSLAFGYRVAPRIDVFAGARYFAVQTMDGLTGIDVDNFDLGGGARYTMPVSPTAKVFGETMLIYSTLSAGIDGSSDSESGIGIGARAGGLFSVGGSTSIGAALSFSTADVSDVGAAWLGFEGFVGYGF